MKLYDLLFPIPPQLTALGLPGRTARALGQHEVYTPDELVRIFKSGEIDQVRGIGIVQYQKIQSVLVDAGLITLEEPVIGPGYPALTATEWEHCLDYWGYSCAVCGAKGPLDADHWIPLKSPVCPGTVAANIVPLCPQCNVSKSNRDALEWLVERYGLYRAIPIMRAVMEYFSTIIPQEQEKGRDVHSRSDTLG